MKTPARPLRWMAVLLLMLWCGIFLRMETTEKSMVRALILQPKGNSWSVGMLYQFPEASADASDASAEIQFCSASGKTLECAIREAERGLPKTANYRLCEYLFFSESVTKDSVLEVEQFLQTEPISRLSARVFALAETEERHIIPEEDELSEETEADSSKEDTKHLPEALLQCAEDNASCAPRLYTCEEGMLLPVVQIDGETAGIKEEGALLTEQGKAVFSAEETSMVRLLLEQNVPHTFELDSGTVTLRRCVVSVKMKEDGFFVRLDGQRKAGTPPVTEEQCRQLETLCVQTIAHAWESGWDILHLESVRALKQGAAGALTTKNACPKIRASVTMLNF